jgi:hypothetical protein
VENVFLLDQTKAPTPTVGNAPDQLDFLEDDYIYSDWHNSWPRNAPVSVYEVATCVFCGSRC